MLQSRDLTILTVFDISLRDLEKEKEKQNKEISTEKLYFTPTLYHPCI